MGSQDQTPVFNIARYNYYQYGPLLTSASIDKIHHLLLTNDNQSLFIANRQGNLYQIHTLTHTLLKTWPKILHGGCWYASQSLATASLKNEFLIFANNQGGILRWDVKSGEGKKMITGVSTKTVDVMVTGDGRYVVSRHMRGEVLVWDLGDGKGGVEGRRVEIGGVEGVSGMFLLDMRERERGGGGGF